MTLPCIVRMPGLEHKGITNNAMISWVDLTPTILDIPGLDWEKLRLHGKRSTLLPPIYGQHQHGRVFTEGRKQIMEKDLLRTI
jgi:N-sulfoglucosamine sulfohydrolase